MARLTSETKEQILADFHTGRFSSRDLADKYNTSHTTINKLVKGLTPKNAENVSTLLAVKSDLAQQSFQEVKAVETIVNFGELIQNATAHAVKRLSTLLESSDSVADHAMAIKAFDTASLTLKVNERHAPKAEIKAEANAQSNTLVITRKEIKGDE